MIPCAASTIKVTEWVLYSLYSFSSGTFNAAATWVTISNPRYLLFESFRGQNTWQCHISKN